MRDLFVKILTEEAERDERIWLLTPDLGFSVLEPFCHRYPDRFLNVGVAEQNAIGIAAGLALSGKIPYVYTIMPFVTSRPYEQVKVDCAYMNTNVRLVGVGAGFAYGSAGATHHSLDDLGLMRGLPNMSVIAPGSLNEAEALIRHSVHHKGPMFIRLNKKGEPSYDYPVEFGKMSIVRDGQSPAIIVTSSMLPDAIAATDFLKQNNFSPLLLSAHTIKPFDSECVLRLVEQRIPIITIEEHHVIGGLASTVSEVIARSGRGVPFLPIAVPDCFSHYVGSQTFIKEKMGLTHLGNRILEFLV